MHEYELLYIVHARKAVDEATAVVDWVGGLITEAGGEVLSMDSWGRRRLAYPIDHELEGTYVLATMNLPQEATAALEAQLVISEDVVRHILLKDVVPMDGPPPAQRIRAETPVRAPVAAAAPADGADAPAAEAPADGEQPAAEAAVEDPVAPAPTAPAAEAPAAAPAVEAPATTPEAEAAPAAAPDATAAPMPASGEEPSPATAGAE
ncbi:MAG: 30S ribosomal protein S6 [Dehalococcoidia bacterium]|nr:30S ribosomal protein S6 [Dehalococcoidia bacterium]